MGSHAVHLRDVDDAWGPPRCRCCCRLVVAIDKRCSPSSAPGTYPGFPACRASVSVGRPLRSRSRSRTGRRRWPKRIGATLGTCPCPRGSLYKLVAGTPIAVLFFIRGRPPLSESRQHRLQPGSRSVVPFLGPTRHDPAWALSAGRIQTGRRVGGAAGTRLSHSCWSVTLVPSARRLGNGFSPKTMALFAAARGSTLRENG